MGLFSFLGFGGGKIKDALKRGAVIIDVRTPQEYDGGKVPGSINIPIDKISASTERIKSMNRPVIFCCASGMRSGNAVNIMKGKGLKDVVNGGSWLSVLKATKSL
jgi:rhodanese-related sulfurtransferase